MLAILDYGAGNQTSVKRALEHVGIPCTITGDAGRIGSAAGVIFPGVGAAGQAMGHLQASGLDKVLAGVVTAGRPLLGICLGCQILLDHSEENAVRTLGLVPGMCRRFENGLMEQNGDAVRIPHMGWNGIRVRRSSPLLDGVMETAEFYFVHSYYVAPPEDMVMATTVHGREFCSVYGRDGLWAVQFHVEKSGRPGLRMLENFYAYCTGADHGA